MLKANIYYLFSCNFTNIYNGTFWRVSVRLWVCVFFFPHIFGSIFYMVVSNMWQMYLFNHSCRPYCSVRMQTFHSFWMWNMTLTVLSNVSDLMRIYFDFLCLYFACIFHFIPLNLTIITFLKCIISIHFCCCCFLFLVFKIKCFCCIILNCISYFLFESTSCSLSISSFFLF